MIRPEKIQFAQSGIAAVVTDVVYFGASLKISARLPSGESLILRAADTASSDRVKSGETRHVSWSESDQRVIDEQPS